MAAVKRSDDNVKKLRRTDEEGRETLKRLPAYVCDGAHNIDVSEELAKLEPSKRLFDYYREKVAKFDNEHQDMLQLLQKYEQVTKPTLHADERAQLAKELIELRCALSDVNVFINAERQQVVRLHAEKERLQLNALDAEKKVALLLSLCGLTEGELKVFLRDPRRTTIIKQRLPPHLKELKNKLREEGKGPEETEAELILRARVQSLEHQLQEAENTWLKERSTLLEERSLTASEHRVQKAKDEAHIKLLSARLEDVQVHLKQAIESSIKKQSEVQTLEKTWLAERDHLLSVLATVKENIPFVNHMEAVGRSGSYTDLTKIRSTCEKRDLRRENESLKRELEETEELRALYESQCHKLDREMCKLREQKEAAEQLYKERNDKLSAQIDMLRQDNNRSEERRRTDLMGFQSDIRLLKSEMKTIVHQLYKITMFMSGDDGVPIDFGALNDMQAAATLARTVQRTIADLKRKMWKVEHQMNHPPP